MTKFKVSGIGLDTSTISYYPSDNRCDQDCYDYIHTSISTDNGFFIKDYIKSQSGATLITSTDFLDSFDSIIPLYLLEIGRTKIDLLLFESSNIESWNKFGEKTKENIKFLKDMGLLEEIGLKNPKTINEIENIENILGENIKYIAIDICPFNFNYEIIEWCINNDVYIIGFNPFGGYISSNNLINSFSIQYLLAFISNYCSVVMLSGRDLYYFYYNYNYIKNNLIGKESSPKYTLKKSIIGKLVKPFKKVINTSIILSDDIVLPYNDQERLFSEFNIELSLGKNKLSLPDKNKRTEFEEEINNVLGSMKIPEDANNSGKITYLRYKILPYVCMNKEDLLFDSIKYLKIGDNIIVMTLQFKRFIESNKWWKKDKVEDGIEKVYILTIQNESPLFIDISNK